MINDRIQIHKVNRYVYLILVCGIAAFCIGVLKFVFADQIERSRISFYIDLIGTSVFPVYLVYRIHKEFKKRAGQFIEWGEEKLVFKLKNDSKPQQVIIADCVSIQVNLDSIELEMASQQRFYLDITDFQEFEDRKRIKENFEQLRLANHHIKTE